MRKPFLTSSKTKMQISCMVTAKLISTFVSATYKAQSLSFPTPKFQASSHLLWLHSPACIGPGLKPEDRFSHDMAHMCDKAVLIVGWSKIVSSFPKRVSGSANNN